MIRLNNPYINTQTLIEEFRSKVINQTVSVKGLSHLGRFQQQLKKVYSPIFDAFFEAGISAEKLIDVSAAHKEKYKALYEAHPTLMQALRSIFLEIGDEDKITLRDPGSDARNVLLELEQLQGNDWLAIEAPTKFQEQQAKYGNYFDIERLDKKIDLFQNLAISCRALIDIFEKNNSSSEEIAYDCAYKLMVLFLKNGLCTDLQQDLSDISAKADKYFNRVDVKTDNPLHDFLFMKELPHRDSFSDLIGWKALIEKEGLKVMDYFHKAGQVEKKNDGKAPTTTKKIQEIWASCLYARAGEDIDFANLCQAYHVSEIEFSRSLDYILADAGWPKKPIRSDNIPEIVIEGDGPAAGFYWVKLPSDDKRALILGNITNCCQHMGGASENCVKDACELTDNAVYVLLKAKNKKSTVENLFSKDHHINYQDFKLIGQSYVWLSTHQNLCLDSIECLEGQISNNALKSVTQKMAQEIIAKFPKIHFVNVGAGGRTPQNLFENSIFPEKMLQGIQYYDSDEQYTIVQRNEFRSLVTTSKLPLEERNMLQYCGSYLNPEAQERLVQVYEALAPWEREAYFRNMAFLPVLVDRATEASELTLMSFETVHARSSTAVELILNARTVENFTEALILISPEKALGVLGIMSKAENKTEYYEIIRNLVEKNEFSNTLYQHLRQCPTAFFMAISEGRLEDVSLLLAAGAHISQKNEERKTPLMIAIMSEHPDILYLLANAEENFAEKHKSDQLLLLAASARSVETVAFLIDKGIDIEQKDDDGATPLMKAFYACEDEIAALLINRGANIEKMDSFDSTPLILAARRGHIGLLQLLINKGANLEQKDTDGNTALINAIALGYTDVAALLIKQGAEVNQSNKVGYTALMTACAKGNYDIVKMLLTHHADVQHIASDGNTALSLALAKAPVKVQELLKMACALKDEKNVGDSPLIGLCRTRIPFHEFKEIADFLIDIGANLDQKNKEGRAASYIAAMIGRSDIFEFLLEKGCCVNAALYGATAIGDQKLMQLCLRKGASANYIDPQDGLSVLMSACDRGDLAAVSLLIESGSKVNQVGDEGYSPLMIACINGHTDVAELLIKHGANLEYQTPSGDTPLIVAGYSGCAEIEEFIGAEIARLQERHAPVLMRGSLFASANTSNNSRPENRV